MHILEPCRKYILCDATIKWVCPLFLGRKIFFHQRLNCRVVSYLPLWTQNFFGMCLMCAKRLYFGGCFIGKYILLSTIHWHMLKGDPPPIPYSEQNLCESSVNVISLFTICVNREICKWQFSLFFVIFSKMLVNCGVISREIAEIVRIRQEQKFTT